MTLRADGLRLLHMARCEGGAIAPIVGVMLPVMFGMLGLVEAGKVYGVKNQLQATADAAAMASVHHVPNGPVTATANEYADRNMPPAEQYGDVLPDSNIEMGRWDGEVFSPGSEPANAVRVTTLAEMPLFFAGALRSLGVGAPDTFTPSAQATALLRPDKCYSNGFVAGGIVQMNSQNHFEGGFCVYGRSGVTMNNSNEFAPGTGVGMLNLSDLDEGGNNPGLSDALVQRDIAGPAAGEAMQLIDDLIAGGGPRPDYLSHQLTVNTLPSPPIAGTLYHVLDAGIELNGTYENIGIVSDHPIKVRSNSLLRNVLLATRAAVDVRANVTIGDADYCTTKLGASLIISGAAVSDKDIPVGTNSNIAMHGVQVVSDGDVKMNSNLTITGVSMQATGNITFNSSFGLTGCPDGTSPNVTGGETMVSQLVD